MCLSASHEHFDLSLLFLLLFVCCIFIAFPLGGGEGDVGLGLHCMLGLRSAILDKPRASLCLLEVSFLLRLILHLRRRLHFLFSLSTYTYSTLLDVLQSSCLRLDLERLSINSLFRASSHLLIITIVFKVLVSLSN